MAARKKQSGNQGGRVGCLFILLAFCVGLLVLLANIGKIKETLDRTNFTDIVKNQSATQDKRLSPVEPSPKASDEPLPVAKTADPKAGATLKPASPASSSTKDAKPQTGGSDKGNAGSAAATGSDGSGEPGATTAKPAASKPVGPATAPKDQGATSGKAAGAVAAPAAAAQKTRAAKLYFVRIDDDGVIARQEVNRQIPASDQPLTDALAALLAGPTDTELRRNLLSLIPQGTKLLSVQVRGSTAILNFNEAFMYNHYGVEGYAGQLKQIVYTATSFASVQDVQILIEGERHDYLGGEGVYIGKPLSRNSF